MLEKFSCSFDLPSQKENLAPKFEPRDAKKRSFIQWLNYIYALYYNWKNETRHGLYVCPICGEYGCDDYPSRTMLNMTRPVYNSYYAYEFGVMDGADWEETHQCENCGTVYSFSNANC